MVVRIAVTHHRPMKRSEYNAVHSGHASGSMPPYVFLACIYTMPLCTQADELVHDLGSGEGIAGKQQTGGAVASSAQQPQVNTQQQLPASSASAATVGAVPSSEHQGGRGGWAKLRDLGLLFVLYRIGSGVWGLTRAVQQLQTAVADRK